MNEPWLKAVGSDKLSAHSKIYPGYALLGEERSGENAPVCSSSWKIRLSLDSVVLRSKLNSLLEDVDEVFLRGEAAQLLDEIPPGVEVFLESWPAGAKLKAKPWILSDISQESRAGFCIETRGWIRDESALIDRYLSLDTRILRNLSLLQELLGRQSADCRYVGASSEPARSGPESLIEETLVYWSAAVGGCRVLEVAERADDSYDKLWSRLGILRLMRWEAGLAAFESSTLGSGFFDELANSL